MVFVVEAYKCNQNGPKMGKETVLKDKHDLPKLQVKVFDRWVYYTNISGYAHIRIMMVFLNNEIIWEIYCAFF